MENKKIDEEKTEEEIRKRLRDREKNARPEIVRVETLHDKIRELYEKGIEKGEPTGWSNVDEYYSVKRGELTIVTGIPGSGKSTWLDALALNLAMGKGWRFAAFSAENLPLERHFKTLSEQYLGMPFGKGPTERMDLQSLDEAEEFISNHLTFIMPKEKNRTVGGILGLARSINDVTPIDGLIIDPWNEITHPRESWCTETEYISIMLTRIKEFLRELNIHVWIVAHPTKQYKNEAGEYSVPKPYDISGGANWWNKADNCISVWRDFKLTSGKIEVHFQKIKWREIGRIGSTSLYFDRVTGRYSDSEFGCRFS